MRILFYSTASHEYDGLAIQSKALPSWKVQWEALAKLYPEHTFIIATQLPGMFLCDVKENEADCKSDFIQYKIIQNDDEEKIARELLEFLPDVAVALSFYVAPFDWLSLKDSMVGEHLCSFGIKTFCHSVNASLISFDKWRTHQGLKAMGVNCSDAVYLHHELFMNAGNRREIKSNVYRSSVFHQIKKMGFPLIIKDTTGLSSYGADVVNSFNEAKQIINSKRTTGDRIIERLIKGGQFGLEVYGANGKYTVLPPFAFSVNRYGITSPKQSVKIGPVSKSLYKKYRIQKLKRMILRVAKKMNLCGAAQFDLVFDGRTWFIIEINPRLSGMSTTYASSAQVFLSELIFNSLFKKRSFKFFPTVNIKCKIMSEQKLEELKKMPGVSFVYQIENKSARQIREQGYCEVIVTAKTKSKLRGALRDIQNAFCDECETSFFKTAEEMMDFID